MGADSPIVSPTVGKPTHEGWNVLHLMPAVALAVGHAAFLYSQKDAIIAEFESTGGVSIPLSQPLSFAFCYVLLVVLGSAYMRKSKVAYEPKEAMLVYNAYETVLSFAMLFFLVKEAAMNDGLGWHAPLDKKRGGMLAYMLWVNYQSKFVEYLDTVFMMLRRKFDQITLLHVSHHAEMGAIMWLSLTFCPGGNSYFGPAINSFIHTVMYAYYFLAALGFRPAWKQLLTSGQLVQFVLVMAQSLYHIAFPNVYWPVVLAVVCALLMVQMLVMFGKFYVQQYMRPKKDAPKKEVKTA